VVATLLAERQGVSEEEARGPAALAGGSLGAALAFESEAYARMREGLLDLLERAQALDPLARQEAAEALERSDDPALLSRRAPALRDVAALRMGETGRLNADAAPRSPPSPPGLGSARPSRRAAEEAARPARFANKLRHLLVTSAGD
jgi:hypothetical protein